MRSFPIELRFSQKTLGELMKAATERGCHPEELIEYLLAHFDAINRMNTPSPADIEELLRVV